MSKKINLILVLCVLVISLGACVPYDDELQEGAVYKKVFTQEATDFLWLKDIEIKTYVIYFKKQNYDESYCYSYQEVTVDEFYNYDLGDNYTRKKEEQK